MHSASRAVQDLRRAPGGRAGGRAPCGAAMQRLAIEKEGERVRGGVGYIPTPHCAAAGVMILPVGASSFTVAMQMGSEVYHNLKGIIKKKYGQARRPRRALRGTCGH